ncbi:RluA family pseudouridine synthase [Bombilactobacillus bombi]|uniref:Pseudouridine synthase n=1 Tax=Bombilactobacillus bombi TaxID=1303590 RepID=A0A3R6UXP0_9LACO|nr:RluA family pseudouridine synthase [Bombilactobacillus bombi]RHW49861.1 RluA family pseudouridine synthase [Bombilactobacillus bombi]
MTTFAFKNNENSDRLDKIILKFHPEYTRAQIQKWIKANQVCVNQQIINKTGYRISTNDLIEVTVTKREPLHATAQKLPLNIIYEDADVLVVNKPQGMVVHPSAGHPDGTLVNAILYHTQIQSKDAIRPGIVHRIDKDTSGLLMVAKSELAQESLSAQIKAKTNLRDYLAIVHNPFEEKEGTIEAPIGRDPNERKRQAVIATGKSAITHFQVQENFTKFALVKCRLETGRTHQIRVHLQYIGHPVAGDPLYGPRHTLSGAGQFLHAQTLGFRHPRTGQWLEFHVDPPQIFQTTLNNLRTNEKGNL